MSVKVKICGLKDAEAVSVAVDAGAHFVGFVFYPPSPRAVTTEQAATLVKLVPPHVIPVGLFVDPSDELLRSTLAQVTLGIIQLHGNETPERVAAIKKLTNLPVMKAIPISTPADLNEAREYEAVTDWFLFDAKPAPDAMLPGGNAETFDWNILCNLNTNRPWMLAGGLIAANIADAVRITGARVLDVSSGVESTRGEKDVTKIREFLAVSREIP